MNCSTVVKTLLTVVTVCVSGAIVYSKLKNESTKSSETEELTNTDTKDNLSDESTTDELTVNQVFIPVACGVIVLSAGLLLLPEAIYRGAISKLAFQAIENGSLTVGELIELSKSRTRRSPLYVYYQ